MKKSLLLSVAAMLLVSGCAPSAEEPPGDGPATTQAAEAAPAADATKAPAAAPAAALPSGLPTGGIMNDGKGDYLATVIYTEDPAMVYDPKIAEPSATAAFTPEEIASAQTFITGLIADEVLDSTVSGNVDAFPQWWDVHKDKFDPSGHEQIYAGMMGSGRDEAPLLMGEGYREGRYNLAYGPEQQHILSRTITPTKIVSAKPEGYSDLLAIDYNASGELAVEVNGEVKPEPFEATLSFTVTRGEKPGEWLILGWTNTFYHHPVG